MNSKYLIASDIDRTLMFSSQYLESHPFEGSLTPTEINGFRGSSFMTSEALRAFSVIRAQEPLGAVKFVPVTSRSKAEFQRITWSSSVEFAIVANGGKVLYRGTELEDYADYLDMALPGYRDRVAEAVRRVVLKAYSNLRDEGLWYPAYSECIGTIWGDFEEGYLESKVLGFDVLGPFKCSIAGSAPNKRSDSTNSIGGSASPGKDSTAGHDNRNKSCTQDSADKRDSRVLDKDALKFTRADWWGYLRSQHEGHGRLRLEKLPLVLDAIARLFRDDSDLRSRVQRDLSHVKGEVTEGAQGQTSNPEDSVCKREAEGLGIVKSSKEHDEMDRLFDTPFRWETQLQTFKMIDDSGVLLRMPVDLIHTFIEDLSADFRDLGITPLITEEKVYLFPTGLDKSLALQWLHNRVLPSAVVLAAGDSHPDIGMLQYADKAFIPENSVLALALCDEGEIDVVDTEDELSAVTPDKSREVEAIVSGRNQLLKCEILRSGLKFSEDFFCRVLKMVRHK